MRMKKTSIDWCPYMPEHWNEKRIKDIAFLQSGNSITALDLHDDATYPVYGGNGLRGYTDTYTNEGDYVLIGRQGALCGNINYAHGKFFATEHAVVVYAKKGEITYWLGETLKATNLNRLSMTAAQPGLAVSMLNNQFIPYPPLYERKQIAEYLNNKTGIIDTRISLLSKKRNAYLNLRKALISRIVTKGLNPNAKLKPSGVDWIGDIPEGWEVKRMKEICTLSPSVKECDEDTEVSYLPMEGLRLNSIETIKERASLLRGKYVPFENEDLLIARVTPCFENGNIAVAKKLTNGIGYGSSEIFVLRIKEKMYNRYLFYISLSLPFQSKACATMCGVGGLKRISPQFMKSHIIGVPPLSDQQSIASYLDEKCSEINANIANLEKQIEKYKELKRALISEVVTGKRRV